MAMMVKWKLLNGWKDQPQPDKETKTRNHRWSHKSLVKKCPVTTYELLISKHPSELKLHGLDST